MRAHVFQHVPFEGPGSIGPWLQDRGYALSTTRWYEEVIPPDPAEIDFLVIMGGPMSVHDVQEHPWLVEEQAVIRRAIEAGVPTLGICLGAQLIATALGGTVRTNPAKEIGWFPVQGGDPEEEGTFRFPASFDAFHWHGETFSLPPDAVRLAGSEACENQAFQVGGTTIGLQFHLETTPDSARALIEHCRHELVAGPFVQTEEELRSVPEERYRVLNRVMELVLAHLHQSRST